MHIWLFSYYSGIPRSILSRDCFLFINYIPSGLNTSHERSNRCKYKIKMGKNDLIERLPWVNCNCVDTSDCTSTFYNSTLGLLNHINYSVRCREKFLPASFWDAFYMTSYIFILSLYLYLFIYYWFVIHL